MEKERAGFEAGPLVKDSDGGSKELALRNHEGFSGDDVVTG